MPGARIVAADISDEATAHAGARFGAAIVSPDEILSQKADILAPCALGGVIDEAAIGALRAGMICGSANNQLAQAELARELDRHGILYCPDYVVNAGGLIAVAREALRNPDPAWVTRRIEEAVATFAELLSRAEAQHRPPLEIADRMVDEILHSHQPRYARPTR